MPHTPSAKKRLKQSQRRKARNRSVKAELRTEVKKVRSSAAAGNADEAKSNMVSAQTKLDRAATRGIIHKNKAARVKSRLSKTLKTAAGKK
ncbi:MAG: 30S ribosomal protein S20 [Planctomycetaceae bacterium]|nr:30S ribosomal protein S20 [Planctomycetaceae bacterium]